MKQEAAGKGPRLAKRMGEPEGGKRESHSTLLKFKVRKGNV